ncbi:hypothetical protein LT679_13600 [Mucilaginibacter roseus]|uniref:Uncharacterized protein n=1 Tax=Mucilaginibacter roseus TaxID=1528868 RepID=A0ABS8U3F6_9SPHI|nr:hypothetical protein [Mucilaginibacter roseus]MCD8741643.1 hypothetical protein [Mucilaginibacter roseus]
MYWYKRFKILALSATIASALVSCKPDAAVEGNRYFDIKGYFSNEAERLTKLHPHVEKTVKHNRQSESRDLGISSWKDELGLFSGSDINKPAWRDSYTVTKRGNTTVYKAKLPELKTQSITIINNGDKVQSIDIVNHTSNLLYTSTENLSYYPDSAYHIGKVQHVRLLGENSYDINSRFN